MNQVARLYVHRYGDSHDEALERNALVVGQLTAA
jgi:hypothetical protein